MYVELIHLQSAKTENSTLLKFPVRIRDMSEVVLLNLSQTQITHTNIVQRIPAFPGFSLTLIDVTKLEKTDVESEVLFVLSVLSPI